MRAKNVLPTRKAFKLAYTYSYRMYGTLIISAPVIKVAFEAIKQLMKNEKGIVSIKKIEADPKVDEMIGKQNTEPNKIMVEIKLDEEDNDRLERIKQEINESGKGLGIETIQPYKYVEKKK